MRYALTYMPDDHLDSVETLIVEAPTMVKLKHSMKAVLRTYGISHQKAVQIIEDERYYIRNCDDIDYWVQEKMR